MKTHIGVIQTVNRWFNQKTKPSKIQEYHIKKLIQGTRGEK